MLFCIFMQDSGLGDDSSCHRCFRQLCFWAYGCRDVHWASSHFYLTPGDCFIPTALWSDKESFCQWKVGLATMLPCFVVCLPWWPLTCTKIDHEGLCPPTALNVTDKCTVFGMQRTSHRCWHLCDIQIRQVDTRTYQILKPLSPKPDHYRGDSWLLSEHTT